MAGQTTDLIKEKIDVADFIRTYVPLAPAGKNLKGLCPFHKEKTPSFIVSPDRQVWHCFGCGAGGDVIGFLMRYENLEFLEALKVLADKAGISIRISGDSDQKKYEVLFDLNRIAKDFFAATLREDMGRPARQYLLSRGLTKETMDEFELGMAAPNADALMRHLTKAGFSVSDIERAGLALKTERGTYWDRFRNRIMFPLYNHFGKVIGFTGRVMPGTESEKVGKYVNSPETPIFNKSKLLFGFFKTKNAIREADTAVLVEGQMDFLGTYQDGIKNVVATSGTALTAEHLKVLRRLAENLVLSFDNDSAGRAAAERTIDLAEANDFNVKVIMYTDPNLKDPADIAQAKPGQMAELISKAVPAMEYYFNYYQVAKAAEISEKKKQIRLALSKIKQISSPVERDHWLHELAARAGISYETLTAEMAQVKVDGTMGARSVNPAASSAALPEHFTRQEIIGQRLIGLSILEKKFLPQLAEIANELPGTYSHLAEYLQAGKKGALSDELNRLLAFIELRSSFEPVNPDKMDKEFTLLVAELKGEGKKDVRKHLMAKIRMLEKTGDEAELGKALEEYRNLTQK